MAPLFFALYLVFWIAPFALERVADLLQLKRAAEPLPEGLRDLQTPADHEKSFTYAQDKKRLEWASSTVGLVFWFAFWRLGGFEMAADCGMRIATSGDGNIHTWWAGVAFVAILSVIQAVVDLPFSIYSTFGIEERYGFNRTTWKTFVGDLVKGTLVSAVIGIPVLLVAYQFLSWDLPFAFVWLWLATLALQGFLLWISPVVLLPIFLKLAPLPDGPLKSSIEAYREKQTFKLNGVWVCDASKRSSKSNAFFTGFGKFRRLVLFDTLIAQQTPEEITAVVAHEAGHFQRGHILKGMALSSAISFFFLAMVVRSLDSPLLYEGFGFQRTEFYSFVFGLPLAVTFVSKLLYPLKMLSSKLSRKYEYEADAFALATTGSGAALGRALRKLGRENLSGIQYHPLYTALHLSHPPLPDRLRAMGEL